MRTEAHYERLANTCRAIVASPQVTQFVVGITTNPSARRQSYKRWAENHENGPGKLDGFVILDWGYSRDDIRAVEEYLFNAFVDHDNYGVIDMSYKPSVYKKGPNADDQSIYIAWWSPYLVISDQFMSDDDQ